VATPEITYQDYISRYRTAISKLAKVTFVDAEVAKASLLEHVGSPRVEALCHCFPVETTPLGTGSRRYGDLFSLTESLSISSEKLLAKGYLALAGHLSGPILIVGLKGSESGWCRWLSIRHRGQLPFHRYLTEDSWRPWEVLEAMRKNRGVCGEQNIDDHDDEAFSRKLDRLLEIESGLRQKSVKPSDGQG
jgi:hypothetical protein